MRHVLYTDKKFFELGMFASNSMMKCFPPDENGEFDSTQIVTQEMKDNILKLQNGEFSSHIQNYADRIKEELLSKPIGFEILMLPHWSGDKRFIDVVEVMNDQKVTANEAIKIIKEKLENEK